MRTPTLTFGETLVVGDLQALATMLPDPIAEATSMAVQIAYLNRLVIVGGLFPMLAAIVSTRSRAGLLSMVRYVRAELQGNEEAAAAAAPGLGASHRIQGVFGDALVYLSRITYHVRCGYPIATWSELPLLLLQSIGWIVLRRRFSGEGKAAARLRVCADVGLLAAIAFALAVLPAKFLPILCLWSAPLAVVSYSQQSLQLNQRGSAASLPVTALWLRWVANLLRVLTTSAILGGDPAVMANHVVGVIGCTALLWQVTYFDSRLAPSRLATRKSLYAKLLFGDILNDKQGFLLWLSLGGFGDTPPDCLPDSALRKAYNAMDTDGNGFITRDELRAAITEGTGLDERTRNTVPLDSRLSDTVNIERIISQMVEVADADGNGGITFAEYKNMILAFTPSE